MRQVLNCCGVWLSLDLRVQALEMDIFLGEGGLEDDLVVGRHGIVWRKMLAMLAGGCTSDVETE